MGLLATDRGNSLYAYWARSSPTCCRTIWPPRRARTWWSTWPPRSTPSRPVQGPGPSGDRPGSRINELRHPRGRSVLRHEPAARWRPGWRERVRTPGAVKRFAEDGYRYDADGSTAQQPVFVRLRGSADDRPLTREFLAAQAQETASTLLASRGRGRTRRSSRGGTRAYSRGACSTSAPGAVAASKNAARPPGRRRRRRCGTRG